MRLKPIITLLVFSFLVAYGEDKDSGNSNTQVIDKSEKTVPKKDIKQSTVHFRATGDVNEEEIYDRAAIFCGVEMGVKELELYSGLSHGFSMTIPMDLLRTGVHSVVGSADTMKNDVIRLYYSAKNGKTYGENVSGSITLTSIPTQTGEYLTGTLQTSATIRYKPERKIEMDVKINVMASSQAFNECK